jgi:hypothetical protein
VATVGSANTLETFGLTLQLFKKKAQSRTDPTSTSWDQLLYEQNQSKRSGFLTANSVLGPRRYCLLFFVILQGHQDAADFARDIQVNFILKPDYTYALELGELDALYFKETVQSDPPTTKKPTLRSHRNIQLAKQALLDSVKEKLASLNPTLALAELKKLLQIIRSDFDYGMHPCGVRAGCI